MCVVRVIECAFVYCVRGKIMVQLLPLLISSIIRQSFNNLNYCLLFFTKLPDLDFAVFRQNIISCRFILSSLGDGVTGDGGGRGS